MLTRRLLVSGAASLALFLGATGLASADAFLCPIVGDGVIDAPGIMAINPPAGTSILPGNNQAGQHANGHALNSNGDGAPNAGNVPGSDGFTPIWTGNPS